MNSDRMKLPLARFTGAFAIGEYLKIARYFVAGVGVSVGYTITVVAMMEWLGWRSPSTANAVSFILWTPVSYIAHRDFTFRFDGEYAASASKFTVTFVARFLTSIVMVAAISEYWHLHYIVPVLANWVALPIITYAVLRLWVFRAQRELSR